MTKYRVSQLCHVGLWIWVLSEGLAVGQVTLSDPFSKILPPDPGPWLPLLLLFGFVYVFWILAMYLMNRTAPADEAPFWNLLAALGGMVATVSYLGVQAWNRLPKSGGVWRRRAKAIRVKGEDRETIELLGSSGEPIEASQVTQQDQGQLRVVGAVLSRAIAERATDIHLEPTERGLRVRFRVDGILHEHKMFPSQQGPSITSCVKVLASIDVAEKRKAQDGSFRARRVGEEYDLRVASSTSVYGEKIVLRILPRKPKDISVERLGLEKDHLDPLMRLIAKPNGMLIITGPTGSGKTTTLYALLKKLDATQKNIITIEDPVEYRLHGITQIQIQRKAGVTFANALESLLRQDPDVLMIGEVRDTETAEMAMQSALTGHLVFTTLHTNDAPQTVLRLLNMGVESYLISAAVKGVLSQRLVRQLCPSCRRLEPATREEQACLEGLPGFEGKAWHAAGCESCRNTGYHGRTGIFELMIVDEEISSVISATPNLQALLEVTRRQGMRTLRQDGFQKAVQGLTCAREVASVVE